MPGAPTPGRMDRVTTPASSPDPRQGAFWRATTVVYWYVVVECCFLLAAAPGLAGILLLERHPSNIPLYALCLVPLGPAFSAAVSTMAARASADEANVWPRYWRAYVRNLRDVLWVWIPALALATVLGTTIAFGTAAGVDLFFGGAAIVLLVALALWSSHALVIASFFRFRARDTARLALYYLAAKPLVTLGAASYLVLATALVTFGSDWMLALAAVVFAVFAGANARPMIADVTARFTADAE